MGAANWYLFSDIRRVNPAVGPADFEALIAAADSRECELDFDDEIELGEPWSGDLDFLDEDPE